MVTVSLNLCIIKVEKHSLFQYSSDIDSFHKFQLEVWNNFYLSKSKALFSSVSNFSLSLCTSLTYLKQKQFLYL